MTIAPALLLTVLCAGAGPALTQGSEPPGRASGRTSAGPLRADHRRGHRGAPGHLRRQAAACRRTGQAGRPAAAVGARSRRLRGAADHRGRNPAGGHSDLGRAPAAARPVELQRPGHQPAPADRRVARRLPCAATLFARARSLVIASSCASAAGEAVGTTITMTGTPRARRRARSDWSTSTSSATIWVSGSGSPRSSAPAGAGKAW